MSRRTNGEKKDSKRPSEQREKKKKRIRMRKGRKNNNKKTTSTRKDFFLNKVKEKKEIYKGKESTFTHPLFHQNILISKEF